MSEKQISGKELLEYVNTEADSGLVNKCRNCGNKVPFDYRTNDDFWLSILMPLDWSHDVLCLPCFTELAGEDVHDNLYVIYYSGGGRTTPFVPAYALAQLEAENEDLRLMLYGQTGWEEGEINERLALLTAEEQEDE